MAWDLLRARATHAGPLRPGGLTLILAFFMLSVVDEATRAQETQPVKVSTKLNCGSHSSDPNQLKSFQTDLQFSVVDSLWYLDRKTENGDEEKFRGIRSPTGAMLIAGQGKSAGGQTWTYEFAGQRNPRGVTVLQGSLESEMPRGRRSCSLAIQG